MIASKLPRSPGSWLALALAAVCFSSVHAGPVAEALPPMPEAVTSFGAVTHDGWLYVFGGHKGERHDYAADKVSGAFHRLNLEKGGAWETLPSAAQGQGQPLVGHGTSVYRVGGMAARNASGGKQDLYSIPLVQRYDVTQGRWEEIASLPHPRSSHDCAVIGDRMYLVGGWSLSGGTNAPVWPDTALVLDLKNPGDGWKSFPQPFKRRALAVAVAGSRLVSIGGMDSDGSPSLAVDIYDTQTGKWTAGPALPAGKFKGFACSAIAQDGRVYANMFQGDLLRLSADAGSWEVVGRLAHPRMAHRLVTAGSAQLIALGGEDGDSKRPDLEVLTPVAGSGQAAAGRP